MTKSLKHNTNQQQVFLLGAPDPEMEYIERVLVQYKRQVLYAAAKDAEGTLRRVRPNEAYKVEYIIDKDGNEVPISDLTVEGKVHCHRVECGFKPTLEPCGCMPDYGGCSNCRDGYIEVPIPVSGLLFDHHNEGDPGYDKPPAEYWHGSSIGQVCMYMDSAWIDRPDPWLLLVAACDHCMGAAYAGMCPGVITGDLYRYQVQSRSEFRKCSTVDIEKAVAVAISKIEDLPTYYLGDCPCVVVYDHIEELPLAACYVGRAYIAQIEDRDGRLKVSLGGAATPKCVERAMQLAKEHGLTGIYGFPIRGMAGGYLPEGKHLSDLI